jgi:hypothetical protein
VHSPECAADRRRPAARSSRGARAALRRGVSARAHRRTPCPPVPRAGWGRASRVSRRRHGPGAQTDFYNTDRGARSSIEDAAPVEWARPRAAGRAAAPGARPRRVYQWGRRARARVGRAAAHADRGGRAARLGATCRPRGGARPRGVAGGRSPRCKQLNTESGTLPAFAVGRRGAPRRWGALAPRSPVRHGGRRSRRAPSPGGTGARERRRHRRAAPAPGAGAITPAPRRRSCLAGWRAWRSTTPGRCARCSAASRPVAPAPARRRDGGVERRHGVRGQARARAWPWTPGVGSPAHRRRPRVVRHRRSAYAFGLPRTFGGR